MVDLDLDVVRGRTGRVWVDDEDEFADHRVRFGYPDDLVRLAAASCDDVHEGVLAGRWAFAPDLGRRWLSRLAASSA
jgi:protein associated with RNAse G/E